MKIKTPLDKKDIAKLHSGDRIKISGVIYTARDAAHKRLIETLKRGEKLPFLIKDQIIYYVGPAPAKPGNIIGPAGPTTSYRMDPFTPLLLKNGLKGMIGKGPCSSTVREAIIDYQAVYFAAIGGAAALISKTIKKCEIIAYPDLGTEAIHRLVVDDFPVVVINDIYGHDLYEEGVKKYQGG
ncbi:MAG TPA: Fe-S-containing hydro-lyase [Halanaerobiales bacterium]|nr:Fe-S-containing hydro-lyase [Halanaerobiales bacterium]